MGFNFFLYGAYEPEQPCYGRFKNFIKNSQTAFVKGTLHQLQCGLPLLLKEGDGWTQGTAVELDIPETQWPIFDAINGCFQPAKSFIVRESFAARMAGASDAEEFSLSTYALNPEKKQQTRGPVEIQNVLSSSLIHQLTERQRTYIYKLSRAKGREIIPVDMLLYRELLLLELIVDKGRRLALTNLGQEVSHFL